ncbi:MAG: TlpA family protein disulfide reductase [Gemmatimonadota bacterium]|nr:TlpA family protein disulfide reductase [Gemmatimonadota bacterium]
MTSKGNRSQWIAVGVIVALMTAATIVGLGLSTDLRYVTVGYEAPEFSAVDVRTGDTLSLSDFKGEVVLLNLWATWCLPCRTEMPSMQRLYDELGPDGLRIVAVSVDQDPSEQVMEFANEYGLTFDVLHDRSGRIDIAYQTTGLPESLILDRDGVIVYKAIGEVMWDDDVQVDRLKRLLADGQSETQAAGDNDS